MRRLFAALGFAVLAAACSPMGAAPPAATPNHLIFGAVSQSPGGVSYVAGGVGTVGSGTGGQIAVYPSTGTTVGGLSGTNVTGAQGNGAKVQLSTGSTTTGDCAKYDANGNVIDAGSACSSSVVSSTNPALQSYTNDTSTGTTLNKIATLNSSGQAILPTTSQLTNAIGIADGSTVGGATGPGTSGTVNISIGGAHSCIFDGGITTLDFAGISSSTTGDCTDLGPSPPPPGIAVIGVITSATNASAGTYTVDQNPVWLASLLSQQSAATALPGYLGGLTLSNDGVTPNTIIDIASGAATSDDAAVLLTLGAFTKTTGSWASGSTHGCLDTGSVGASSWYHVFVISKKNGNTVDVLCSLSATAPTMPSNYTKKRRIGSFKTDGSNNILAFTQRGSVFWWKVATLDVSVTNLSTSQTLETLNVPSGVVVQPLCRVSFSNAAAAQLILLSPDVTDIAPASSNPFTAAPGWDEAQVSTTTGGWNGACPFLTTNTAAQIGARASASSTTLRLVTTGWID